MASNTIGNLHSEMSEVGTLATSYASVAGPSTHNPTFSLGTRPTARLVGKPPFTQATSVQRDVRPRSLDVTTSEAIQSVASFWEHFLATPTLKAFASYVEGIYLLRANVWNISFRERVDVTESVRDEFLRSVGTEVSTRQGHALFFAATRNWYSRQHPWNPHGNRSERDHHSLQQPWLWNGPSCL